MNIRKISLEAERYFTKYKLSERHEAFKFKKGDLVSWTNDYGVEWKHIVLGLGYTTAFDDYM